MSIVDNVSEIRKESWTDVYAMNFAEFCLTARYLKAKRAYEKAQMDEYKKSRKL